MTESQAMEIRRAAWRIRRLCCALDGWSLYGVGQQDELVREARESAAALREMVGPPPKCNGNSG